MESYCFNLSLIVNQPILESTLLKNNSTTDPVLYFNVQICILKSYVFFFSFDQTRVGIDASLLVAQPFFLKSRIDQRKMYD